MSFENILGFDIRIRNNHDQCLNNKASSLEEMNTGPLPTTPKSLSTLVIAQASTAIFTSRPVGLHLGEKIVF
jgi:hypothetical protein